MKPQYINLVGTTPKIIGLNNNNVTFEVSIYAPGMTVELSVIDPDDSVAPNSYTPPVTTQAPVWVAPPNAVNANGVLHLTGTPYSAVRITPVAGGVAVILQQGLR